MNDDAGATPHRLAQLAARLKRVFATVDVVPFQYRNRPPDGAKDGLGEIHVPGAVAQSASKAITHHLGRTPVGVTLVDNAALAPTRLQVTVRSTTSVTISPLDAALDATALVRIF